MRQGDDQGTGTFCKLFLAGEDIGDGWEKSKGVCHGLAHFSKRKTYTLDSIYRKRGERKTPLNFKAA